MRDPSGRGNDARHLTSVLAKWLECAKELWAQNLLAGFPLHTIVQNLYLAIIRRCQAKCFLERMRWPPDGHAASYGKPTLSIKEFLSECCDICALAPHPPQTFHRPHRTGLLHFEERGCTLSNIEGLGAERPYPS